MRRMLRTAQPPRRSASFQNAARVDGGLSRHVDSVEMKPCGDETTNIEETESICATGKTDGALPFWVHGQACPSVLSVSATAGDGQLSLLSLSLSVSLPPSWNQVRLCSSNSLCRGAE